MNANYYQKIKNELDEAKLILDGLKQIKEKNVQDGPSLMKEMKEKYGL